MALIPLSPNTNLALFYKAQILIWHLLHKTQIIIWQLFFLKPKWLIWHNSTKSKYYLSNYFTKPKILFWQALTKLKYYWHLLNPSLMGKYDYSRNISCTKLYGNYDYCCHKQLTIKPMSITHGKATHLVGLKPSPRRLINKAQPGLAGLYTQIQQIGKHVNYSAEFQQKGNSWSSLPSSHNLSNLIRTWTRVQQSPFSTS